MSILEFMQEEKFKEEGYIRKNKKDPIDIIMKNFAFSALLGIMPFVNIGTILILFVCRKSVYQKQKEWELEYGNLTHQSASRHRKKRNNKVISYKQLSVEEKLTALQNEKKKLKFYLANKDKFEVYDKQNEKKQSVNQMQFSIDNIDNYSIKELKQLLKNLERAQAQYIETTVEPDKSKTKNF